MYNILLLVESNTSPENWVRVLRQGELNPDDLAHTCYASVNNLTKNQVEDLLDDEFVAENNLPVTKLEVYKKRVDRVHDPLVADDLPEPVIIHKFVRLYI